MKTFNATKEFKEGEHSIGYVSSTFEKEFKNVEFEKCSVPTFQVLPRDMTDVEIESELKPGMCELGDLQAFLENPPKESKDGSYNLFYFKSFVVDVRWLGAYWHVYAWGRDGGGWLAGDRVFSPATTAGALEHSGPSDLNLESAIALVKKEGFVIFKSI